MKNSPHRLASASRQTHQASTVTTRDFLTTFTDHEMKLVVNRDWPVLDQILLGLQREDSADKELRKDPHKLGAKMEAYADLHERLLALRDEGRKLEENPQHEKE